MVCYIIKLIFMHLSHSSLSLAAQNLQ